MASVSFADAMVGRLLDALDAGSAAHNTIVVLWSDHGWHLGEKNRLHKMTLWERSTRIPMVLAASGWTEAGGRCDRAVGAIDLFPTLIQLCDLPELSLLDGQSLVPLLKDPAQSWTRPALTTYGQGNHAVRSDRYRFIQYANGDEELYDHQVDPHEWHNLASDSRSDQIKEQLRAWLPEHDAKPLKQRKPNL